jgi:choline dehydrogenase-like flavoprotein
MMRPEYDVVVVGSGYGGAVAASRMARAGKSVCLLELGKERWPGEYPVDFLSAAPEIHISGNVESGSELAEFDGGDPQGLYHIIVGKGQTAFVANGKSKFEDLVLTVPGLGGTSLLNANVFLPADHRTLSQGVFPPEIRNDPSCLDECIFHIIN